MMRKTSVYLDDEQAERLAPRPPGGPLPSRDLALGLEGRYADLDLGLADCALVVLADRYRTERIVTFDERFFRAVASLRGEAFTVLPADA